MLSANTLDRIAGPIEKHHTSILGLGFGVFILGHLASHAYIQDIGMTFLLGTMTWNSLAGAIQEYLVPALREQNVDLLNSPLKIVISLCFLLTFVRFSIEQIDITVQSIRAVGFGVLMASLLMELAIYRKFVTPNRFVISD